MKVWVETAHGKRTHAVQPIFSDKWLSHSIKKLEPIYSDLWLSRLERHRLLPPAKNPSENITGERSLLRHLGYKGDLMSEVEDTDVVNERLIERLLKGIERQKTRYLPGTKFRIEVGEFPNVRVVPL